MKRRRSQKQSKKTLRSFKNGRKTTHHREASRFGDNVVILLSSGTFIVVLCLALWGGDKFQSAPSPDIPMPSHAENSSIEVVDARPKYQQGNVGSSFTCSDVYVVDGDTLRCGDTRIRLAGIDAPEMPGHCRSGRRCVDGNPHQSKRHLESLVAGKSIVCNPTDIDRYGRTVAICSASNINLSCSQISSGNAVNRYGNISC